MRDLAGSAWGVLVFSVAVFAPGYCLGQLTDVAEFRTRALREQLAWAAALSFGPGVLLIVGAVWLGGATAGALLLLAFGLVSVWLLRNYPPRRDLTTRHLATTFAVFAAWTCCVLGSLVDIGTHAHLWMSVTAYDHGLRTAFVDAVLRTGLPPVDPVYWPGHDTPMRYYYFWYAVCASVARLAHISARQALIASCVWPPVGVVAMLALFGRYVLLRRGRELTRMTAVAAALLAVTGLDILVTIALHLLGTPVLADMEWWSIDQVASWPDTFLWVPHHAAALIACLCGLLLLRQAEFAVNLGHRLRLTILAGLSFSAAFGISAYLAVGAAIVLAASVFVASLRAAGRWRALQNAAMAASVSALMLSGFVWQLTRSDGARVRSASPLYLGLREILSPEVLAASPLLHPIASHHPWGAREIAAAVLLLPGWGVELGFFAAVFLAAVYRFHRLESGERTLLWLTLAGFAAASFVRSGVISTNDYGIRAALLPQFFLLLLGACVLGDSSGGFRRFLHTLIVIGVAGCAYQVFLLRVYLPWNQLHGNPYERDLGERTYVLRELYGELQTRVPGHARIQFDPASVGFYLYPHLLFANRQMVTSEITCSTSFGGDPAPCPLIGATIRDLFPTDAAVTPNSLEAQALCRQIGAEYLVATRWDDAWQSRSNWVWTLPPVVNQPAARVLSCGPLQHR